MDCPLLRYSDGGSFDYEYFCAVTGEKLGDQQDLDKVFSTCKKSHFVSCPYFLRQEKQQED